PTPLPLSTRGEVSKLAKFERHTQPSEVHFSAFFKYLSNQLAILGRPYSTVIFPWSPPTFRSNSAGTPTSFSRAIIRSACSSGTSGSLSPCTISVGGLLELTW